MQESRGDCNGNIYDHKTTQTKIINGRALWRKAWYFFLLSVVLFKSKGWLLVLLEFFILASPQMTIICGLWRMKCSTDFHLFLASWTKSFNPDNRCQVECSFLWTHKIYMKIIYFTFWQEQAVNAVRVPRALANLMVMCVWAGGILW